MAPDGVTTLTLAQLQRHASPGRALLRPPQLQRAVDQGTIGLDGRSVNTDAQYNSYMRRWQLWLYSRSATVPDVPEAIVETLQSASVVDAALWLSAYGMSPHIARPAGTLDSLLAAFNALVRVLGECTFSTEFRQRRDDLVALKHEIIQYRKALGTIAPRNNKTILAPADLLLHAKYALRDCGDSQHVLAKRRTCLAALLSFFALLRPSEAAALRVSDIRFTERSMQVFIAHSKGDRRADGAWIHIPSSDGERLSGTSSSGA